MLPSVFTRLLQALALAARRFIHAEMQKHEVLVKRSGAKME